MEQKDLEKLLAKDDTKVSSEDVAKMKENILKAGAGGNWLGVGVHDVEITGVELTQAKTGTLGIKFTVENDEGMNEVTMWLSERALPYTIQNISAIGVHNTPEEKREKLRTLMANVTSAQEAYEIAKAKFVGFKAYLDIKESKTQTYTNKYGETKPSLERNLRAYKPKVTVEQVLSQDGGEKVDLDEVPFL